MQGRQSKVSKCFVVVLWWLTCSSRLASCKAPPHPQAPPTGAGAAMMKASELEAVFQVIESLLEVPTNFRTLHPRPCTQDLLQGMLCEQGGDKLMHVTRLQFGSGMRQRCKLSATLPGGAIFSQMPFLRTLLVSECIMSQRSSIPVELSESLQELSLRSNKALVGSIPAALGQLRNLQVLSLAQNNLEGGIPAALGGLKLLEHLDLSYNVLTGSVPPVLGQLPKLSILDLSGNLLQGTIPTSFSSLKALQKLDLSSNQLRGAIPTEMGKLANLQFLALSQNGLTGPLPASLARLSNLEYFLMDGNPVHGPLPPYLAAWTQLRELSLADSFYSGPIPSDLHTLFNASVINLSNNKLDGTLPPSLDQMQHLTYLNLSQNSLSGPVPFCAHFIQRLGNRLDLHGNPALCVTPSAISFSANLLAQQLHTCGDTHGQLAQLHKAGGSSSRASPHYPPSQYYLSLPTVPLHLFLLLACISLTSLDLILSHLVFY